MAESSNHAIVFGASSLVGWALVDHLLGPDPDSQSFSKITAIANRPLDFAQLYWAKPSDDRELQLVSGIDLRQSDGLTLAALLAQKVKNINTVTHVYYLVFTAIDDEIEEVATNRRMFENVIDAHNLLSPNLKFVAFTGGTRGYGIYAPGGTFTPPLTEDMVHNLPSDYVQTVVYPAYRELLNEAGKGKNWTWCEVCPDAIIGFTPNGSQFSLALHWAQYLSLYADNHGITPDGSVKPGGTVEVPFPGNVAGANSLFSPVASKTIARFMIYASFHPERCGNGQLFNIADSETPCKYGEIWTRLAEWFGLVGVAPTGTEEDTKGDLKVGELPPGHSALTPGEYVKKYSDKFAARGCLNAVSGGVGVGSRQLDSVGYWLTFDRQMSLTALKKTGFKVDQDPVQAWLDAFKMFRVAGLIL
ncbi:hypothetical protein N7493_010391 [Penicillium malachiteum]|uniref:PRISE-like Rossmann-fold domain-containing protein n=1 Tax=Penicillium malachiteum TaxID=1324776 RepID=A0AAD6MRF7_9EURO|nr:hypothetical protein N7493_010391 [Penicillium malachiteum]